MRTIFASVLALLAGAASAWGQAPPIPAAPGYPAVPGVPAAPASAAQAATAAQGAGGGNIWSKICMTPEQKAACKKHFCESGLVQFLGVMMKPMTFATGGLIKPCCPGPDQPRPEDLAKPADSVDGAASRVKEDEANAKARRANVRYLGTVDCSRYPEVEKALINALRTDHNECVRWEAAIVLGSGCCCTRKTVEALMLTATGSDKDGNPKESSGRVRCAAEASLHVCEGLADLTPEPPERAPGAPEKKEPGEEARLRLRRPMPLPLPPAPVQQAQQPIQTVGLQGPQTPPAVEQPQWRAPSGQRGIFDVMRRSFSGNEPPR